MKAYFSPKLTADTNLKEKTCLIGISVGQPYHKKECLEALIKLLNKQPFAQKVLMVADTLQAWNILMEQPNLPKLDDARKLALEKGNQFLKNIKDIIPEDYKIIRWDSFLKHKDYQSAEQYIKQALNTKSANHDSAFTSAVNKTANTFLAAHARKFGSGDYKRDLSRCTAYLIEELAVMYLWITHPKEFPYDFTVYPKAMHQAARYLCDKLAKGKSYNLFQELTYTINNSSSSTLADNYNTFYRPNQVTSAEGFLLYFQTILYKLKLDPSATSKIEILNNILSQAAESYGKSSSSSSSSSDEENEEPIYSRDNKLHVSLDLNLITSAPST